MSTPSQKPLETFRLGNISVAVWVRHKNDGTTFLTVSSPSRSYKIDEVWKRDFSLGIDEIRTGQELLKQAEIFMKEKQREMESVSA